MDFSKFEETMKNYLEAISLTKTQDGKITEALDDILSVMLTHYPEAKIYAQGSYATDTMVKPLTARQGGGKAGEFDIDIAIERDWEGAEQSLDDISEIVKGEETFQNLSVDDTKNTCVRIEHEDDATGVGFHIDLVPTKATDGERYVPNREEDEWKPSDAKQFAEWFNAKADKQPELRSVAVIIKRLRDIADLTNDFKSILILTLVSDNYHSNGSTMADLVNVLDGAQSLFSDPNDPPFIANPVNEGENLADGINDYTAVQKFIVETADKLKTAIAEDDAETLKEIFGPGFTYEAVGNKEAVTTSPRTVEPTRAYGVSDAKTEKD